MKYEKLNSVLGKPIPEHLQEEDIYRSTGIHYSDLSSLYANKFSRLDPERSEAARAALDTKEEILMGYAFEHKIEKQNVISLPEGMVVLKTKAPSNMTGTLAEYMINNNLNPQDVELVDLSIVALDLWKSDSAKNKEAKTRANILANDKNFVEHVLEMQAARDATVALTLMDAKRLEDAAKAVLYRFDKSIFTAGDLYFQVPMEMTLQVHENLSIHFVIMADLLVVNEQTKTIKIVDMKYTQKSSLDWGRLFWSYGYWIQAVLYREIAKSHTYDGWTVDMEFLVASHENPYSPIRFPVPEDVDFLFSNDYKLPGYKNAHIPSIVKLSLDLLKHRELNEWNYPIKVVENNFQMELKMYDFKNVNNDK